MPVRTKKSTVLLQVSTVASLYGYDWFVAGNWIVGAGRRICIKPLSFETCACVWGTSSWCLVKIFIHSSINKHTMHAAPQSVYLYTWLFLYGWTLVLNKKWIQRLCSALSLVLICVYVFVYIFAKLRICGWCYALSPKRLTLCIYWAGSPSSNSSNTSSSSSRSNGNSCYNKGLNIFTITRL